MRLQACVNTTLDRNVIAFISRHLHLLLAYGLQLA